MSKNNDLYSLGEAYGKILDGVNVVEEQVPAGEIVEIKEQNSAKWIANKWGEPIIKEKKIGKLYYLDIFYGNGTSKLVSNSWRNKNLDIFFDIGSHIFDLFSYLKIIFSFPNNIYHSSPNRKYFIFVFFCSCMENEKIFIISGFI